MVPQVAGPLDVVARILVAAAQLLEVRGLRADEEGVDVGELDVADQPEEHPHAHPREELHGLLVADRLGGAEDAVGPAHLIVDVLLRLTDEKVAGPPLVVDEHRHDIGHLLDELVLRPAERGLVGDLVEVPHRLRSLSIEPADGQRDLVEAAEHLVDLPGDDERREVEHHAHADPGADVRRAGGEVAPARVEGVGDDPLDLVIDNLDLLPRAVEVEAAVHALDAEVILLVDHQAHLFEPVDGDAPCALGIGMLAADQLPLDEEAPVDFLKVADVDVIELAPHRHRRDPFAEDALGVGAVLLRRPAHERKLGEVARQTHPAAHHDVGIGPRSPEPFPDRVGERVEPHAFSSPALAAGGVQASSIPRMASRASFADS